MVIDYPNESAAYVTGEDAFPSQEIGKIREMIDAINANNADFNNPYDFYVDGNVAISGDGSIESPFKTLTELNNKILSFPANVDQYIGYLAPFPSGYGNEVVGTLLIAENLNLRGQVANVTIVNCSINLTSSGLGSGSNVVTYKNIALTNILTLDLTLSTFAFISLIDGEYNLTRIDNNTNANVNLQGGLIVTNIGGGKVNLLSCSIFGNVNVSGGATLYSVNTELYGGIFKLVGNCTLKTLSTLNPSVGYVDGTVDISGTPTWYTDEASNQTYTGTVNKIVLNSSPLTTNYGLYAQTANSTPITGTNVESSLIGSGLGTLSVPANTFKVGDSFVAKLYGHITCVGTATIQIRIKSGSVLLADTGIITLDVTTNKHWNIEVNFTIRSLGNASVGSIVSAGLFSYIKNSGLNFEGANFVSLNNTTFDTTILNTLSITAQWNTNNAGNNIYSDIFVLNKIY